MISEFITVALSNSFIAPKYSKNVDGRVTKQIRIHVSLSWNTNVINYHTVFLTLSLSERDQVRHSSGLLQPHCHCTSPFKATCIVTIIQELELRQQMFLERYWMCVYETVSFFGQLIYSYTSLKARVRLTVLLGPGYTCYGLVQENFKCIMLVVKKNQPVFKSQSSALKHPVPCRGWVDISPLPMKENWGQVSSF